MSTNKTPNLQMNSWVGTDMVDFNEINENFNTLDTSVYNNTNNVNSLTSQLAERAYSVKTAGCKGDGVTDDTQSFQNAVNYCITNGIPLFIPSGKYKITSPINITKTIYIFGVGYKSQILNNSSTVCFNVDGTINPDGTNNPSAVYPYAYFSVFENFLIFGNSVGNIGMKLKYATNSRFHKVVFEQNTIGLQFNTYTTSVSFSQCHFKNSGQNGVDDSLHANTSDANISMFFSQCIFEGNGANGAYITSQDAKFSECILQNNTINSIHGVGSSARLTINQCYFEEMNVARTMVKLEGYASFITNCEFHGNGNGTGIEYTTLFNASNIYFSNMATGINYTGSGGTSGSCVMNMQFSSVTVTFAGTDNIISTGFNAQVNALLVKGTVTISNPSGYMPVHGTMAPDTTNTYDLGTASLFYRYVFANVPRVGQHIIFGTEAATSAANSSLFVDSADNKMKYKDSSGVVNLLY